jgi:cytochrome b6-f complex iron-sulfur subunit
MTATPADREKNVAPGDVDRRAFLAKATGVAMAGGLVAGYGAFGAMAGRFLYPAKPTPTTWLYVKDLASFRPGTSLDYKTPAGASVAIARRGDKGAVDDFVALSSTCPHLGCKVHWEQPKARFFCPCHNGAFDALGAPTEGPPKEANQSLPTYPLKVENGLLFIEVPLQDDVERRASPIKRKGGGFPV